VFQLGAIEQDDVQKESRRPISPSNANDERVASYDVNALITGQFWELHAATCCKIEHEQEKCEDASPEETTSYAC